MTPLYSIDFPSAIYEQREEARRCADLWADEASRAEYRRVMQWFLADRQETLRGQGPAAGTYFPRDLWQPDPAEHFVDCGAFDGDSIRCFLDRTDHQFRKVTAYEPDPRNIAACESHLAACSEADRQKIHLVKAAVGEQPGEVHFSDHGGVDSSVGGEGGLTVRCISLDEEHRVDPPTFLKMDIEGYEPSALRGGRAMITAHAPILAITLYHEVAHLWQIPLLLHSFRPDYQFYLRRYAEDCWETVCYAVPPHRVLPR